MDYALFHGTKYSSALLIETNGIRFDQNTYSCDFGYGFYLSPDISSAKTWARRKAFRDTPAIIEVSLRKDFAEHVKVKDFGIITDNLSDDIILKWAQFIINNRCGLEYVSKTSLSSELKDNSLDASYDIVIGQIADGSITQIASDCKRQFRPITISEAHRLLNTNFGIQYCLCSEKALSVITKKPRIKKGVQWR